MPTTGPRTAVPSAPDPLPARCDVAVVGAGGAGLTAAVQAAELGLRTIVLEKADRIGGNTVRASSGMNAADTLVQIEHRIVDSARSFYDETLRGGGGANDPALLAAFVRRGPLAIEWLAHHGIPLDDLTTTGAMSRPRTHRPATLAPIGRHLVDGLARALAESDVPVATGATAVRLLPADRPGPGVSGVAVRRGDEEQHVRADAVILASGGFAANAELVTRLRPELGGYRTTNHPGATGDGLGLAEQAGGRLRDLDRIQVHPTVQQDTERTILIGEAVRGEGAILVDRSGCRFCDELGTRERVTAAIDALGADGAHLVLDQQIRERIGAIEFYDRLGLVRSAPDLAGLARAIGVDAAGLVGSVDEWNQAVAAGSDPEQGRRAGMDRGIASGPFHAIHVSPAVHYTMGGVAIDDRARVLDAAGDPVPGLLAAGEVTGGLHGTGRIGGNSIAETVVFGLEAAREAFRMLTAR